MEGIIWGMEGEGSDNLKIQRARKVKVKVRVMEGG
jgi:hypothetical protein